MSFSKIETRGVTASVFIDLMWGLYKKSNKIGNRDLFQLSSREVVSALIQEINVERRCSFVEWLVNDFSTEADRLVDHSCDYVHERTLTTSPLTFVSHAWEGKFRDIMYMPQYLWGTGGTVSEHSYWIDLFAIDQSDNRLEVKSKEIKNLKNIIKRCERTVLIMDESSIAPTRIWCVFEIWHTILANRPLEIVFGRPNGIYAALYALCILAGRYSNLDIRKAQSSRVSDKKAILADIELSDVGFDQLNEIVREALFNAAKIEVTEKAHLPAKVTSQAVELIVKIGWNRVLQNNPDTQRVITLFSDHVRYQ